MSKEFKLEDMPKPCPNCGREANVEQDDYLPSFFVKCVCGLTGMVAGTIREAVNLWNRITMRVL